VIHRDIKPANILFTREGRPCLADFGVAKSDTNALLTRTGQIMGTPAYVAPEQALGERVDARADLYALGMTFYKALTGRLPFSAEHALQTLVQRLKEDPKPLRTFRPDLDAELESIVMRALRREREDRWPEARAMADALLAYAQRHALAWGGNLEKASAFELPRTPIALVDRPIDTPGTPTGSLDPTLDFPRPVPPRRRWWIGALAAIGAVGFWWTWGRFRSAPVPQANPAPSSAPVSPPAPVPAPAASVPAPVPAPVPASTPAPKPRTTQASESPLPAPLSASATIRRPAVYPELLEGRPVPVGSAECAGQKVNVALLVGEDGSVKSCKILSKVSATCAEAARAAAMRYRFRPAMDAQGKPLETSIAAAVDFPEAP
jgi:serine/threonine-protein kinase